MMLAIVNRDMLGATTEPGEHVDWSTADLMDEHDFAALVGDVAEYAAANPHMIVMARYFDRAEEARATTLEILQNMGRLEIVTVGDYGHEDPRIGRAEDQRDFPDYSTTRYDENGPF